MFYSKKGIKVTKKEKRAGRENSCKVWLLDSISSFHEVKWYVLVLY